MNGTKPKFNFYQMKGKKKKPLPSQLGNRAKPRNFSGSVFSAKMSTPVASANQLLKGSISKTREETSSFTSCKTVWLNLDGFRGNENVNPIPHVCPVWA